jgi:hypothetical protein
MEISGVLAEITIYNVKDRLSRQFKLINEWLQDLIPQIWLNFVTVSAPSIGLGPLFS